MRFAFSTGDGNNGISHMQPDGHVEAEDLSDAIEMALDAIGATDWLRANVITDDMADNEVRLWVASLPDDEEDDERDYAPWMMDVFPDEEE